MKTGEIDVATIHHIDGSRFEDEIVEDVDVVNSSWSNDDKGRNVPSQIEQGVKFDGGLALSKLRPGKKRKTEIDGGGVQSIYGLIEFQSEIVVAVELSGDPNEHLCKVCIDPPRSSLVGVGQGTAGNLAANTRMIEFGFHGSQASFDIA